MDTREAAFTRELARGGLQPGKMSARAVRATLSAVAEGLTTDEAQALEAALPPRLRKIVAEREHGGDMGDAGDLFARVAGREGLDEGRAREHAEIVIHALGAMLEPGLRRKLVRAMPEDLGRAFAPAADGPGDGAGDRVATGGGATGSSASAGGAPGRVDTLASGRPGSKHPLATSAPPDGQLHSVARNDDPHAESKLASAHGTTQEREEETLATGSPPAPGRPVSTVHD